MFRAKLVTGERTVAGPGENKFLQCELLPLTSGKVNEESPGIPSGLFLKATLGGLTLPKRGSIIPASNLDKSRKYKKYFGGKFGVRFEPDDANW